MRIPVIVTADSGRNVTDFGPGAGIRGHDQSEWAVTMGRNPQQDPISPNAARGLARSYQSLVRDITRDIDLSSYPN